MPTMISLPPRRPQVDIMQYITPINNNAPENMGCCRRHGCCCCSKNRRILLSAPPPPNKRRRLDIPLVVPASTLCSKNDDDGGADIPSQLVIPNLDNILDVKVTDTNKMLPPPWFRLHPRKFLQDTHRFSMTMITPAPHRALVVHDEIYTKPPTTKHAHGQRSKSLLHGPTNGTHVIMLNAARNNDGISKENGANASNNDMAPYASISLVL